CYCPPHRGHFNSVNDIIKDNSNVKAVIYQRGNEKRHGVPYDINKKIWKYYINYLLPRDRISLNDGKSYDKFLDHHFLKNCDEVIFVRGNEYSNVDKIERNFIKYYEKEINNL